MQVRSDKQTSVTQESPTSLTSERYLAILPLTQMKNDVTHEKHHRLSLFFRICSGRRRSNANDSIISTTVDKVLPTSLPSFSSCAVLVISVVFHRPLSIYLHHDGNAFTSRFYSEILCKEALFSHLRLYSLLMFV